MKGNVPSSSSMFFLWITSTRSLQPVGKETPRFLGLTNRFIAWLTSNGRRSHAGQVIPSTPQDELPAVAGACG